MSSIVNSSNYARLINNLVNNILQENTTLRLRNNERQRFINNTLYEKKRYKNVISEEGKNSLKRINITEERNKTTQDIDPHLFNNICPVSQEKFKQNEIVVMLPCKHIFNDDAIMVWLENEQATCPVCRYKLDSVEVRNSDDDDEQNNQQQQNNENIQEMHNNIVNPFLPYRRLSQNNIDISNSLMNPYQSVIDFINYEHDMFESRNMQNVIYNSLNYEQYEEENESGYESEIENNETHNVHNINYNSTHVNENLYGPMDHYDSTDEFINEVLDDYNSSSEIESSDID